MQTANIQSLENTSPRDFQKRMDETARTNAEIVVLEKQLGLTPSRLSLNLARAKARLAELRNQAVKMQLKTEFGSSTAIKFQNESPKSPAEARRQIARSGGTLSHNEFSSLSPDEKMEFCKAGGKVQPQIIKSFNTASKT